VRDGGKKKGIRWPDQTGPKGIYLGKKGGTLLDGKKKERKRPRREGEDKRKIKKVDVVIWNMHR